MGSGQKHVLGTGWDHDKETDLKPYEPGQGRSRKPVGNRTERWTWNQLGPGQIYRLGPVIRTERRIRDQLVPGHGLESSWDHDRETD